MPDKNSITHVDSNRLIYINRLRQLKKLYEGMYYPHLNKNNRQILVKCLISTTRLLVFSSEGYLIDMLIRVYVDMINIMIKKSDNTKGYQSILTKIEPIIFKLKTIRYTTYNTPDEKIVRLSENNIDIYENI